jgi:hypothetical protein
MLILTHTNPDVAELENYFGRFYKKRINHKDFQFSTALNLKKVIFVHYLTALHVM